MGNGGGMGKEKERETERGEVSVLNTRKGNTRRTRESSSPKTNYPSLAQMKTALTIPYFFGIPIEERADQCTELGTQAPLRVSATPRIQLYEYVRPPGTVFTDQFENFDVGEVVQSFAESKFREEGMGSGDSFQLRPVPQDPEKYWACDLVPRRADDFPCGQEGEGGAVRGLCKLTGRFYAQHCGQFEVSEGNGIEMWRSMLLAIKRQFGDGESDKCVGTLSVALFIPRLEDGTRIRKKPKDIGESDISLQNGSTKTLHSSISREDGGTRATSPTKSVPSERSLHRRQTRLAMTMGCHGAQGVAKCTVPVHILKIDLPLPLQWSDLSIDAIDNSLSFLNDSVEHVQLFPNRDIIGVEMLRVRRGVGHLRGLGWESLKDDEMVIGSSARNTQAPAHNS
ncbi:hypothetical protein FA13DRAFT_1706198 [Coprinellus micaceus]|uniref:Uncharacterized protein n=1 Tax=Coprinellus micaceus TaxID=71717 RepID=A0A4Y7TTU4_COPMI|nr:hypothetical protein FA13DRAFT_1706198 [Coprinellus micaceus]